MTRYFKIRDITTGLYSSGGDTPSWSSEGKRWKRKNHATSHITLVTNRHGQDRYYDSAELVEFEYEPTEISSMPLRQIIQEKKQAEEEREKRYKQSAEAERYRKAQEIIKQYESNNNMYKH